MNAQDYISSGMLEAYVLGSLDLAESEQVAGAICRFPEVAAEVANIEELLFRRAQEEAVVPPAHLQDQIWAAIQASSASTSIDTAAQPPVNAQKSLADKPATKVIPFQSASQRQGLSWQAAALALLLGGSVLANIMLWNSKNAEKEQALAMQGRLDSLGNQQRTLAANIERYRHEADMMAQPGMMPIVMQSTQKGHPMAATMYWDKSKGEAYVSVQKLPPPPEGMQYQLWAIADGKPVDIGMLENEVVAKGGMQKVPKAIASSQAFAISLEKAGGSPTPTADRIYVMGKMPA